MTDKKNGEMSFLDHLEELRWHIIRSFIAVIIVSIVAFIFNEIVFDSIIIAPKTPEFWTNRMLCKLGELVHVKKLCINSKSFELKSIYMASQFMAHIKISLIAGVIVAFPYVFFEFWRFINPALYQNEQKHARGAVFYTSLLFTLGVLFGYFLIVPLSVHFLGSYRVSEQVANEITLMSYISTVASVTLASGIVFELPVVVYFLSKLGIINAKFLRTYRKHALIVILALSAIITPPDIFSQILVSVPLILLYEISIRISQKIEKRQEKEMAG
ncbi:MAG: twin-arginine translocase subunit TatC [Bacteroidales bacterium]|nr:twin-arginine translocase subunit TatC [Bacteroidales bacterium]